MGDLLRDVEPIAIDDQTEERLHSCHGEPRNARTIAPELTRRTARATGRRSRGWTCHGASICVVANFRESRFRQPQLVPGDGIVRRLCAGYPLGACVAKRR